MLQPDIHITPAPFEMNPGWAEEVMAGPGPPPRRARKKHRLDTVGPRALTSASTQSTAHSAKSQLDLVTVNGVTRVDSSSVKRFQRADEEPWASTSTIAIPPTAHSMRRGSSIGLAGWSTPEMQEVEYTISSKPVSARCIDSLPPFMSTLPADVTWMKDPPPSASFMSGKEARGIRSRSGSHTSVRRECEFQLYPPIREDLAQEQVRTKRADRVDSSHEPSGQQPDRNCSPRIKARNSPMSTAASMRSASSTSVTFPPLEHFKALKSTHDLSIGTSAGKPHHMASAPLKNRSQNKEARAFTAKDGQEQIVVRDSSLNTLQELVSPSSLLNSRFIRSPAIEARISLPDSDSSEDVQLQIPTIVDGWFAREELDLGLPVPRDRSMRWSLDI